MRVCTQSATYHDTYIPDIHHWSERYAKQDFRCAIGGWLYRDCSIVFTKACFAKIAEYRFSVLVDWRHEASGCMYDTSLYIFTRTGTFEFSLFKGRANIVGTLAAVQAKQHVFSLDIC